MNGAGDARDAALDAALDAATIDDPRSGRCLDERFEIRGLIARGGMGEVYEGFDRQASRAVAIKILAPKFESDPELRARFRREAEVLAKLEHPHIVSVIAVGDAEPPYFVMELLSGRTLSEHIRLHSPLAIGAVIDIGVQLLGALGHLHDRGLIHRDVKPANVIISPEGKATLLDLGIARDEDSRLTITGATVGTPEYMAPEQAREAKLASRASDLYSAGATIYAAWVGGPPFTGSSTYEIVSQHHHREVPPPSSRRKDLPRAIDAFIARALAKDPADRFRDASEMRRALEALREARSRRAPTSVAVAIAALAAAAITWTLARSDPDRALEPREHEHEHETAPAPAALVERAPEPKTATVSPPRPAAAPPPAPQSTRAAARAPAPAPQEASVRVISLDRGVSTYAEITIDDLPPRHSPIARWVLTPGPHTLVARREGYAPQTQRFELAPGEHKKLQVTLEPLP